ncbi:MAG: hypothetical protein GY714_09665 [Desulfobacterales bacterium]|nr:hypothetical protein [Desulfobacterales bacterium]
MKTIELQLLKLGFQVTDQTKEEDTKLFSLNYKAQNAHKLLSFLFKKCDSIKDYIEKSFCEISVLLENSQFENVFVLYGHMDDSPDEATYSDVELKKFIDYFKFK